MRVKLLDSQKITEITPLDSGGLINRGNILVGSSLCAALVMGYPLIGRNEAYAAITTID